MRTKKTCKYFSNHMFNREIWDKFSEFTFLNEVNFPQISRINM